MAIFAIPVHQASLEQAMESCHALNALLANFRAQQARQRAKHVPRATIVELGRRVSCHAQVARSPTSPGFRVNISVHHVPLALHAPSVLRRMSRVFQAHTQTPMGRRRARRVLVARFRTVKGRRCANHVPRAIIVELELRPSYLVLLAATPTSPGLRVNMSVHHVPLVLHAP